MLSIIRVTILSLFFIGLHQPVLASSNRNNSVDVANEDKSIRRPSLSLESNEVYNSVPTGSVISFAGDKAPQGWLFCDGQDYSDADYPELYRVIGLTYVPKDSHIHKFNQVARHEKFFCVPDLRGRTSVGVDSNANRVMTNNTLGASGGEEKHLLTIDELAKHTHKNMGGSGNRNSYNSSQQLRHHSILHDNVFDSGPDYFAFTKEEGGNQSHNNMSPYLVLNYIIKTGKEESDGQRNKTIQRDIELDNQRSEIAQLKQELNNLKIASAKAWVIFDGRGATILDSYGVSSVIKNSIGDYTINFSKSFSSKNYCFTLHSGDGADSGTHILGPRHSLPTATSFRLITIGWRNNDCCDVPFISACFYGKQ